METKHMRPLTEDELQTISGGNIFKDIWNWIKEHVRFSDDPNNRVSVGGSISF